VHYIFELHDVAPEHGSSLLTFELQLKTFPSMIASDLYHNVIYKNLLPQTSASMTDTIKLYAWQNTYRELTLYYTNSQLKVEEFLSPLASPPAAAPSSSTSLASEIARTSSATSLSSSSNHFKRKSFCKQVTDTANLTEQLFNSKTYRSKAFQILAFVLCTQTTTHIVLCTQTTTHIT
jgi:hypothetical protein